MICLSMPSVISSIVAEVVLIENENRGCALASYVAGRADSFNVNLGDPNG